MTNRPKMLRPCLCGCGRLTGGLYTRGHDQTVRIGLACDMASGIQDAAQVLASLADEALSNEEKRQIYAEYRAKYPSPDDDLGGQAAD
jgi:hypothetical protein